MISTDRSSCLDQQLKENDRIIMLFDLSVGGHHPAYIQHLIQYWGEHRLPGRLKIVTLPKFLEQHKDVVDLAQSFGNSNIHFSPISETDAATLAPRSNFISRKIRNLKEWRILHKYTRLLKPSECLIMYFDTYQFPIRFLGKNLPCSVSGIYFRARFHYSDFQPGTFSWKEKIQQWWEQNHIFEVARHPKCKTLFCLDPFAVKYFEHIDKTAEVVYLPDPVQIYTEDQLESKKLKTDLGIDPDRQVFLLFGVLDGRKGLHEVLDAVLMMPAELCKKLCLLLVGPISAKHKARVQGQIAEIAKLKPAQIIVHDQFVPDRQNQPYFQLSDVVLATYQRHIGTSSILIRAAAAGKPVLSTNYGLMGEWTRHYQLGLVIDSTKPAEIAKGIAQLLQEPPQVFCDRDKVQNFALQNSAKNYASIIFQNLLAK